MQGRPLVRPRRQPGVARAPAGRCASLSNVGNGPPEPASRADALRAQILELTREYHAEAFPEHEFVAGESAVPVSGKVFDAHEIELLVDSSLDFWLTTGRYAETFEKRFAKVFGRRHAILVNSGSSANLVACSALTSPKLGKRRLKPGDEVITAATGFPTTVNPIIQNGAVPVFLDVDIGTYNADLTHLEDALTPRTRAVMMAHTLGNPFDLDTVARFCADHDLFLVEDCCDAVGSTYGGQHVGSFGDFATVSFYPAHHITMGEGGAVITNKGRLKVLAESFRDWGRDCWCEPGKENTCGKRFDQQFGDLPHGYDHKYVYSHLGYNLKLTDMQAAVGVAQLDKLDGFVAARRENFRRLHEGLRDLEEVFVLPEATPGSDPSWFGFPLAVRPEGPVDRNEVIAGLEERKVATRLLFAGNVMRQPAYRHVAHRAVGSMDNADYVMANAFWLGVYPGLDSDRIDYMIDVLHEVAERGLRRSGAVGAVPASGGS